MGLDFAISRRERVVGASWAYSGFMSFRKRLAKAVGIDLKSMVGFGGCIEWDEGDPLYLFLNHSDCDGELYVDDCAKIWPRLQEIVQAWDADDYDRQAAEKLIGAMRECAENGHTLIFC